MSVFVERPWTRLTDGTAGACWRIKAQCTGVELCAYFKDERHFARKVLIWCAKGPLSVLDVLNIRFGCLTAPP